MDFVKALSFSAVFIGLLLDCSCVEIKVVETYGENDDGLVNHGGIFSIHCLVEGIRVGNVAVWYRKQGDSLPVVLGFNDFIMDPASKIKLKGSSVYEGEELTAYVIELKDGLTAEYDDSGDYGCAISSNIPNEGDDHSQMDIAFTSLIVLDPIDSLNMYSVNVEDMDDPERYYEEYYDGQDVEIDPGQEFYFRCVARASNPPADIRVFHANKEITGQYKRAVEAKVLESEDIPGSVANHHLAYDVIVTSSSPMRIDREDNKRPLTCNATIPHEEPMELTILPTMLYVPEVQCKSTVAKLGEENVEVKCRVRATPPLENAQYSYNETTSSGVVLHIIKVGENDGPMYMKKESGEFEDQYVYSLEFSRTEEASFRTYEFEGRNRLGQVKEKVKLILDPEAEAEGSGQRQQALSVLALLSFVALCLCL